MFASAEIKCYQDGDCPSQLSCIDAKCRNPCAHSNPCKGHEECQVQNHQSVCVKGKLY